MSDESRRPGTQSPGSRTLREAAIVALVVLAFIASYRFAQVIWPGQMADAGGAADAGVARAEGGRATTGTPGPATVGGGCCATSSSRQGAAAIGGTEGAAVVSGGVQRIDVEVLGSYRPSTIVLQSGIPAEITFGQSDGCTAVVRSRDLGFEEDLTAGPKTVKLAALAPGTYGFACGMDMVRGEIIVK